MKYILVADSGKFDSIKTAAFAEQEIDWFSQDQTDADACTTCFGAWDIQKDLTLKKSLCVTLAEERTFDLSTADEDTAVVFVGLGVSARAAAKYGFSKPCTDMLENDGYRITGTVVNKIPVVCIYGKTRAAALYGTYGYQELHGIRFVTPGDEGILYDPKYDRSVQTYFDICQSPSFKTRGAFGSMILDSSIDFLHWCSHAKLNYGAILRPSNFALLSKLAINATAGKHEWIYRYMDPSHEYPYKHALFDGVNDAQKPEDPYTISPQYRGDANGDGILSYGEAHPEWYAEVNGERRLYRDYKAYNTTAYATGDYICTSNEEGTAEYIRLIVDSLADGEWKHISYFDFWGLDNGTWCDCEECRKDKVLSYRQLMLAYRLDKAIKQATAEGRINRKINIIVPAYHETLEAPDKPLPADFDYNTISVVFFVIERCYLHNIDDPICTETNVCLYNLLKAWTEGYFKGELFIGEYYNVSAFVAMPFVFKKRILHDIPFYHAVGARHFHYMHITARQWGISAITNYLYTKLLWDVNSDGEALQDEYFFLRYGSRAAKMRHIYELMEEAAASCKFFKHYQYIHGERISLSAHLQSETPGFPDTLHMRLDSRSSDPQAGLSLREVTEQIDAVCEEFDQAICAAQLGGFFAEDKIQLDYGKTMIRFLYHAAQFNALRTQDPSAAEEEFEHVRTYGEQLRNMTQPLAGYDVDGGNLYTNGLTASWITSAYEKWCKEMK